MRLLKSNCKLVRGENTRGEFILDLETETWKNDQFKLTWFDIEAFLKERGWRIYSLAVKKGNHSNKWYAKTTAWKI